MIKRYIYVIVNVYNKLGEYLEGRQCNFLLNMKYGHRHVIDTT